MGRYIRVGVWEEATHRHEDNQKQLGTAHGSGGKLASAGVTRAAITPLRTVPSDS